MITPPVVEGLNGQSSNWKFVKADIPEGSVLGPLLFLIQGLIPDVKLLLMILFYFSLLTVRKFLLKHLTAIY